LPAVSPHRSRRVAAQRLAPGSSEGLAAATQFVISRREVSLLIVRPDRPEEVS
jgi:hypothetical protein